MTEDIPDEASPSAVDQASFDDAGGKSLDELLAEFDSANAKPAESPSQEINVTPDASGRPPWKHPPSPTSDGNAAQPETKPADAQAVDLEPTKQELHDFMYRVGGAYHAIQSQRKFEVAQRDYKGVVDRVQKAVKDAGLLHVPDDYAETAILARQAVDPELVRAFDDRNKSADHAKQFNRLIDKFERSLVSKARKDQAFAEGAIVQADREAIAAALKGGSGKPAPESPPNYNSLSDADLAKEWAKVGG